jgi:PleD family two-component response regulator
MRVLVVDDEVRLARHVGSALTVAGHDPKLVHDGESALAEGKKTRSTSSFSMSACRTSMASMSCDRYAPTASRRA